MFTILKASCVVQDFKSKSLRWMRCFIFRMLSPGCKCACCHLANHAQICWAELKAYSVVDGRAFCTANIQEPISRYNLGSISDISMIANMAVESCAHTLLIWADHWLYEYATNSRIDSQGWVWYARQDFLWLFLHWIVFGFIWSDWRDGM